MNQNRLHFHLNSITTSDHASKMEERKKERQLSDVATMCSYGVASFLSWFKFIYNPKTNIERIRKPQRLLPPLRGENLEGARTSRPAPILPQGQAPLFPQGWLKFPVHQNIPTMIRWTIGDRVHQKSSARWTISDRVH